MYITVFTVHGRGLFPLDMLRYDRCFPYASEDVSAMEGDVTEGPRVVKLAVHHSLKNHYITVDRWSSFGWRVQSIVSTQKIAR